MSEDALREIIEKVDLLTAEEQLRLIATLAEKARPKQFWGNASQNFVPKNLQRAIVYLQCVVEDY